MEADRPDRYTCYPRSILWLLRGGEVRIGGAGGDTEPAFTADVEPFYLGKHPVTNVQFEAHDPGFARSAASSGDEDPAAGVSFERALGYCRWYAEISRKPMRLPTEVEWEYACRGGRDPDGPFVPGRPNGFGLYGMLGGVWEWTASLYLPYPAREGDDRNDPERPGERVLRGGSFRTPAEQLGSAVRRAAEPDLVMDDVGFRIARSLR